MRQAKRGLVPVGTCFQAAAEGRESRTSGDDIGGQLILDERNAVAQHELALFQPLHLDLVMARRTRQRLDRGIEIAVLLLQACQFRAQRGIVLGRHSSAILFQKNRSGSGTWFQRPAVATGSECADFTGRVQANH